MIRYPAISAISFRRFVRQKVRSARPGRHNAAAACHLNSVAMIASSRLKPIHRADRRYQPSTPVTIAAANQAHIQASMVATFAWKFTRGKDIQDKPATAAAHG